MQVPVSPEDVKIVQGSSGRGLQVVCTCGAVNWNHLEIQESLWECRNCKRVFTHYFPGLVVKVLQRQKPSMEAQPAGTKT